MPPTRILPVVALLLAAAGCGPRTVVVHIRVPDESGVQTPVAGARFVALPFDRDSVLAELAAAAPSPRPSTERLDSLFQAFRDPFTAYLRLVAAQHRLRAARDSLAERAARGPAEAGSGPGLTARLAQLDDSLAAVAAPLEAARAALAAVRAAVVPAADSLRRLLVAWEDTAYRPYDSLALVLARQRRLEPVVDSTDAAGWGRVRLRRGTWWITARAVNVLDPYTEWYWNVPVAGDTVRLTPTNGRTRPRL